MRSTEHYSLLRVQQSLHVKIIQRRIFRKAFYLWQSSSDLRIREVYSGDADILISFVRQVHGDGYPFDRAGGTLAHAFYPHSNKGKYLISNFL